MITIVDYGVGNISAISNIYKRLNIPVRSARTTEDLRQAERIILPGVGAFDWAMMKLNQSGMRDALDEAVLARQVPVLGICVGMQMMANNSEEGSLPGLRWIDAEVRRLDGQLSHRLHLPHMGWNDVEPRLTNGLFNEIGTTGRFYFLHSYYFEPKEAAAIYAVTEYGQVFACSVHHRNVYGVQFHPEKSHHWGIQLLKNFAELR